MPPRLALSRDLLVRVKHPMRRARPDMLVEAVTAFAARFYPTATETQLRELLDCEGLIVRLEEATGQVVFLAAYSLLPLRDGHRSTLGIYFDLMLCDERMRGRGWPHHAYFTVLLEAFIRYPWIQKRVFVAIESLSAYIGLVRYARRAFPVHHTCTPEAEHRWARIFGKSKFGARYDEKSGSVQGVMALSPPLGHPDAPSDLADPHVRYFLDKVARPDRGDTLLVVSPICTANALSLLAAMVRKSLRALRRSFRRSGHQIMEKSM